ncbi:MAG: hypothetical protein LBN33_04915, partial [Desulfovibrio sp.]|jgi:3-phosphoshikimate 1-carboxyvinyltransferase|nr:hypothetical protein [Desulfovibrio sp.]
VGLTLEIMEHFGVRAEIRISPERGKGMEAGAARVLKDRAKSGADLAEGKGAPLTFADLPAILAACEKGGDGARDLVFAVPRASYQAADYAVEGDWSGASYFLAAGAVGPRAVRVSGLKARSLQADAAFLGILEDMGARVEVTEQSVSVSPAPLRGVSADLGDCPDLAPTLAALAAHARGATVIKNVAHLKIKESDRLLAPAQELGKAGCVVEVKEDGLVIIPPEGGPAAMDREFSAHNDHRMAMSLALLGLPGGRGGGPKSFVPRIDNPACVAKSFPDFWECWDKVLR